MKKTPAFLQGNVGGGLFTGFIASFFDNERTVSEIFISPACCSSGDTLHCRNAVQHE